MHLKHMVGRLLLPVVLPLTLVACASGGGPSGEARSDIPPDAFMITVENNVPNLGNITVLLVPEAGVRAQLGQVAAGESESFVRNEPPGRFRLIARTPAGEQTSQQFQVYRGSEARWSLQTNRVIVSNE